MEHEFTLNTKRPINIWTGIHFITGLIIALLGFSFWINIAFQVAIQLLESSVMGVKISNYLGLSHSQGTSMANPVLDITASIGGYLIGTLFV